MVTVERMLRGLSDLVVRGQIPGEWHRSFIQSVNNHIATGKPLSIKQSDVVLNIADSYVGDLALRLNVSKCDVTNAIRAPIYERKPYESTPVRNEVRYVGEDKLAFRFQHTSGMILEIKGMRGAPDVVDAADPRWDPTHKLWVVTVTESILDRIFSFISKYGFEFDVPTLEYLTLCENSKGAPSTFVFDDESGQLVGNVCNNPILVHVVETVLMGVRV